MQQACFKCRRAAAPACIPSRDGAAKLYCADCFTEFCTKTLRDNCFSHCHLPSDTPIALAVSGGPSSMMMLHQLGILRQMNAMRQGAGNVQFCIVPFHLVEEELLLPPVPPPPSLSSSSVVESLTPLQLAVKPTATASSAMIHAFRADMSAQFSLLRHSVEEQAIEWQFANSSLFAPGEVRVFSYSDVLKQDELQTIRACIHHPRLSLSDREELYARVRMRVLQLIANRLILEWGAPKQHADATEGTPTTTTTTTTTTLAATWKHLMLGDNAVTACVSALEAIICGGGGERVVHSSGFRGFMHGTVLMRPMRTLLPKEIVYYARLHSIQTAFTPSLATRTSLRSIRRTLENFVHGIMQPYRTMIFNILNTTAKLSVHPHSAACVVEGYEGPSAAAAAAAPSSSSGTSLHGGPDMEEGGDKPAKKRRVILGKTAQYHRDALQASAPPQLPAVSDPSAAAAATTNGTSDQEEGASCVFCGYPSALCSSSSSKGAMAMELGAVSVPGAGLTCFVCRGCRVYLNGVSTSLASASSAGSMKGEAEEERQVGSMGGGGAESLENMLFSLMAGLLASQEDGQ